MYKKTILFLTCMFFVSYWSPAFAIVPLINPNLLKNIVINTPAPTLPPAAVITPSLTPAPPTNTPIPPTLTPIPPTKSTSTETTIEPTQSTIATPSITQSVVASTSLTTIPQPSRGGLTQTEMLFGAIGGLFGTIILVLLWPKVKLFIHNKTA